MKFDDRLVTAMRIGASGPAMSRIELRQLLDLLGASPAHSRTEAIETGFARVAELSTKIPPGERAAILGASGLRLRSARLVALLATSEPDVAEAAIARANLTAEEWLDLIPAIPPAARNALRTRSDLPHVVTQRLQAAGVYGRALPSTHPVVENAEGLAESPAGSSATIPAEVEEVGHREPDAPAEPTAISALVKRIEAYRIARKNNESGPRTGEAAPRLPLGEDDHAVRSTPVTRFDFSTDAAGLIDWAEPEVAAMVVGTPLLQGAQTGKAALQRRPIFARKLNLCGAPAIAGDWQLDAIPRFSGETGAFLGFDGRLRRSAAPTSEPGKVQEDHGDNQTDRIRQALHELRTPVNAIQGFAEVIQQQLFGPTPHEYRALAANIAGDAARMLAAFEELERLARLEAGVLALESGTSDLLAVTRSVASQLAERISQRKVSFDLRSAAETCEVPLPETDCVLLAWRLLATLGGAAVPGESLPVEFTRNAVQSDRLLVAFALPACLAGKSEEELLQAAVGAVPQALAAGVFGIGFALRLARAEARAAGGDLEVRDGKLLLSLPDLTRRDDRHSAAQSA